MVIFSLFLAKLSTSWSPFSLTCPDFIQFLLKSIIFLKTFAKLFFNFNVIILLFIFMQASLRVIFLFPAIIKTNWKSFEKVFVTVFCLFYLVKLINCTKKLTHKTWTQKLVLRIIFVFNVLHALKTWHVFIKPILEMKSSNYILITNADNNWTRNSPININFQLQTFYILLDSHGIIIQSTHTLSGLLHG